MEPMLDCEAVMKQLWDYLDGELTPERLQTIEAHVKTCKRCSPHAEFERAFLGALNAARANVESSGPLRQRVLARLRDKGFTG